MVAVALFEEQAAQQIIEPGPPPPAMGARGGYRYEDDVDVGERSRPTPSADKGKKDDTGDRDGVASRGPAPAHAAPRPTTVASKTPAAPPPAPSGGAVGGAVAPTADRRPPPMEEDAPAQPTNRPGLGTEYGEQRYSATSFTRFERASDRPVAIAELRYNDSAGLMALGIQVQPMPDAGEIMTRETADPFPGDRGYARPPR